MPETLLETSPASKYAVLVTLTWGDPGALHIARYTQWDEPLNITIPEHVICGDTIAEETVTFASVPSLAVDMGEISGSIEDKPTKIEILATKEPFASMVLGFRHARVSVKIEHVDPDHTSTLRTIFFGFVQTCTKNPGGRPGLIRATCGGVKAQLAQIRLGIPATSECQWQFGGFGCGVDRSTDTYTGTVTALGDPSDNAVTLLLPGVTVPATQLINVKYRRGQVRVDGLSIPIRVSHEDGRFELFSIPPPSWAGADCTLLPGCDKRYTTCKSTWNNKEQFLGCGIAIPPRNPVFEQ